MKKSLFASKTVWVNVIVLAAGIVSAIAGSELIAEYPQLVAGFVAAQSALNVVLRLITTKPIR